MICRGLVLTACNSRTLAHALGDMQGPYPEKRNQIRLQLTALDDMQGLVLTVCKQNNRLMCIIVLNYHELVLNNDKCKDPAVHCCIPTPGKGGRSNGGYPTLVSSLS